VGGLLGRIISIDDDTATIETTPGIVLRCRRTAIAGRSTEADVRADADDVDEA
jgi:preprotein translocase subunit YajC